MPKEELGGLQTESSQLPVESGLSVWMQQRLNRKLKALQLYHGEFEKGIEKQIAIERQFLEEPLSELASGKKRSPEVEDRLRQRMIGDAQLLRGWYEEQLQKQTLLEGNIKLRLKGEPELPPSAPLTPEQQKKRNRYTAHVRSADWRQNQLLHPEAFPSRRRQRIKSNSEPTSGSINLDSSDIILIMNEPAENSPIDEYLGPLVEARLMEIAEKWLGFVETPELVQAREKLKPDQLFGVSREIIIAYQRLGEKVVEVGTDSADPKPQIGLIVAVARLKYANGFHDAYRDDMVNAALYATNIGEHQASLEIRHILHKDLKGRKMGN